MHTASRRLAQPVPSHDTTHHTTPSSRYNSYSDDLGGVALAFSEPRVKGARARLHPYFPFLGVTAAADVRLFRPRAGRHLVGRVIKVGVDYIGLLVLGVFNAAVGVERIRREFKCRPEVRRSALRCAVQGSCVQQRGVATCSGRRVVCLSGAVCARH